MALQVSAGGAQTSQEHIVVHTRVPVVPQEVVHEPTSPRQQVNGSSQPPVQSSSMPLQVSGAVGLTSGFVSLQSVASTPPTSGHAVSPKPSPSASFVVCTHVPRIVSSHWSLVHMSPSLQSTTVPGEHIIESQTSAPLQITPSLQSESFWQARRGQPSTGSQVVPSSQRLSSGSLRQVPSSQVSWVQATSSSHSSAVLHPASGTLLSGTVPSMPPSIVPPSEPSTDTQVPSRQSSFGWQTTETQEAGKCTRTTTCSPETNALRTRRRATKPPPRSAVT
jgi:hypothetical protein